MGTPERGKWGRRRVLGFEIDELLMVWGAMAVAGFVKGTIGFTFPLVALSLASTVVAVEVVVPLMTFPILASNLWQGLRGGFLRRVLRRFWPLVVTLAAGILLGAHLAQYSSDSVIFALLGSLALGSSLLQLLFPNVTIKPGRNRGLEMGLGLASGIIGGMTAVYGTLIAVYLTALHLPKHFFVATVGTLWFCAGIFLLIAFGAVGSLTASIAGVSLTCVVPTLLGVLLGQRLRDRISQKLFARLVLIGLMLVGLNLLRRAFD